jgi:hypothetical protein
MERKNMRFLVRTAAVIASAGMLAACGDGGPCGGIDLKVEPYAMPTNVHLYVTNDTDEPKIVRVNVVSPEGRVVDSSTISAPANGIGEDKSGTYRPSGHEVVIASCS